MIQHLLFDLDNTLYPESAAMDTGITERMLRFVADFIRMPLEEAKKERLEKLPRYGTTLEWLRAERGLTDVDAFFAAVHPDCETDELTFDAGLRPLLQSLNLPMSVLTNSPMEHAIRVLDFFGIRDLFKGIYDLRFNEFRGKPWPESYTRSVAASGFSIGDTLFLDDHPKYIRGYTGLGGSAVLIDERGRYADPSWPVLRSVYELPAWLEENRRRND